MSPVHPGTLQTHSPEAKVMIARRLGPESLESDYNALVRLERLRAIVCPPFPGNIVWPRIAFTPPILPVRQGNEPTEEGEDHGTVQRGRRVVTR